VLSSALFGPFSLQVAQVEEPRALTRPLEMISILSMRGEKTGKMRSHADA